jgi:Na+/H+ antiporter NhaD/arsenite permease-like protein
VEPPLKPRHLIAPLLLAGLGLAAPGLASELASSEPASPGLGTVLPAWSALPFAGILLSIALFPLFAPRFWHHHYPKVSLAWGLLLVVPFVWVYRGEALHEILHMALLDYIPFIILLAALFTIGGGIYIRGSFRGSPWVNGTILLIGTFLASWIGTTGAAMLLIRPLLRANANRRHRAHTVVFFIFLVANIGGSLTPLGDPPLFLGFLHGVPFFWTFGLGRELVLVSFLVLAIYMALDSYFWKQETAEVRTASPGSERLRVDGGINLLLLAGVLLAVIVSGIWHPGEVTILGIHQGIQNLARDAFLLAMLAASWFLTARPIREANGYSWGPIQEVAILFAAIFATIIPPLAILKAGEAGALAGLIRAVQTPAQFFWATGILSSFLDNAPTYLTFLSTALGRLHPGLPEREAILRLIAENNEYLKAIATGAVFMGANTYIGNAPNFMVKAIAEESGVEMPSFFGYMKYSLLVLVPVFLLATWIFF